MIRLVNNSTVPFQGWLRCNIDVLPPLLAGSVADPVHAVKYVVGNRSGLDTYNLDVYTGIGPGEHRVIDLTTATPLYYGYAVNAVPMWGGVPITVAGVPLDCVGAVPNGAAIDGHWRGRVHGLYVDLWVTWYPSEQEYAVGEIAITGSTEDAIAWIPDNLRLVFGDADILVPGLQLPQPGDQFWPRDPLMRAGDWLADGQSRLLPLVLCWPRHTGHLNECRALAEQQIQIHGLQHLHQSGNPHLPPRFNAAVWTDAMLPDVISALHHWRNSPLDPATVSGMSGAQGAQSFVGGPAMIDPIAVGPLYLGALDGSWPMFYLEPNGTQLDWRAHPGLRLYYGKVNLPISTDTLGKSAWPTLADSHGHAGPEDEHWFDWVLFAGARLKGTPATQWHLRAHAIQFLFRYVVEAPGNWLTANRGIGWMSFLAAELYQGLADRDLAEAVKARWNDIYAQLIYPMGANADWWDWRRDDRIGPGIRAIPWQACVFALGLDWAGRALGNDSARAFAANIAPEIMARAYVKVGDRWTTRDVITQDGSDPGPYLGAYDFFGMPMVVGLVDSDIAREIMAQLKLEATTWGQASWLAPVQP
jgi:hypothetical protein